MKGKITIFALNYGVLLFLICVLAGVCFVMVPSILSLKNIFVMLQQAVVLGLLAYGLSFVMTCGGLDLSLSGIAGLASVLVPFCLIMELSLSVALLITMATVICCGLLNGLIVTLFSVPSFLMTLAMLFVFRGGALLIAHDKGLSYENVWLQVFGHGGISVIPYSVFVLLGIMLFSVIVYYLTAFGRYAFSVGSNEEASRLSGVKVRTVKLSCFILSALYAGIAGIILFSYTGQSQANYGINYELDALVAVMLGGLGFRGGQIRILPTLLAVILVVLLSSFISRLYLEPAINQIVQSIILILAVIYNSLSSKVQDNLLRASGN